MQQQRLHNWKATSMARIVTLLLGGLLAFASAEPASAHSYRFCQDDIYSRYLKSKAGAATRSKLISYIGYNKDQLAKGKQPKRLDLAYLKLNDSADLAAQSSVPMTMNSQVRFWLSYFQNNGRKYFLKWLIRRQALKEKVLDGLSTEALPEDLFYLAMIESGLKNSALSVKAARGTWQFMTPTARHYGLKVSDWQDERRDPYKSTQAAAKFLKDLYKRFGHWYLAIASYNAGPGKVNRSIKKARSDDFWQVSRRGTLMVETKDYVPKFLAAILMAKNPEYFGFSIGQHPPFALPEGRLNLTQPTTIADLAAVMAITAEDVKRWNPELVAEAGTVVATPLEPYPLRVPKIYTERYTELMQELASRNSKPLAPYRVTKGDSVRSLTRKHGLSRKMLHALNPKLTQRPLKVGMTIFVPKS